MPVSIADKRGCPRNFTRAGRGCPLRLALGVVLAVLLVAPSVAAAAPTITGQTNQSSTSTSVFTGGDTSNIAGTADSGVYYRFVLKNPSGTVVSRSTCPLAATLASTSV